MKTKFLIGLLIGIVLISGCVQNKLQVSGTTVKILNAKLEAGGLVLSLEADQSIEKVRVELVDDDGQVLCTKYKDLVKGVTEFELRDCAVRKRVTVSVSPPGGSMITRDFQFKLPAVRIKNAGFESGNIVVTLDADIVTNNVRIDILDESDRIICTQYKDLSKGAAELRLTDCEIRERITVSVSPPKAEMITKDFTLTLPEVRIKDVKSELGKLILSLDANMDITDARIHAFGKQGEVLCTKTENLAKGLTKLELSKCSLQKEITISVSAANGKTTTRDFTLKMPLLELKEGFRYLYSTAQCPSCSKHDSSVYVTKETSRYWEGISGIKMDDSKKAYLMRFRIDKVSLDLSMTLPLTEDRLFGEVDYIDDVNEIGQLGEAGGSMLFAWTIIMRDISGFDIDELITTYTTTLSTSSQESVTISTSEPELYGSYLAYTLDIEVYRDGNLKDSGEFIISVVKPYIMIETNIGDGPQTSFKNVEQKEFSLDDYAGYSIGEWAQPTVKIIK